MVIESTSFLVLHQLGPDLERCRYIASARSVFSALRFSLAEHHLLFPEPLRG